MKKQVNFLVTLLILALYFCACTPAEPPVNEEQQGQQNQQGESEEKEVLPSPDDFNVPLAVFRDVEEYVRGGRESGYDILSLELAGIFELENGTNLEAYKKGENPGTVKLEVYRFEAAWKWDDEWVSTEDTPEITHLIYEVNTGEYCLKEKVSLLPETLETYVKEYYAPPVQPELAFRREGYPYWTALGDDKVHFLDEKDAAVEEIIGEYGAAHRHRFYQWEGFYAEIYHEVEPKINLDRKFSTLLSTDSSEYYTTRDVHVGSTETELKAAYPEAVTVDSFDIRWPVETTGTWYWFDQTGKYDDRMYCGGLFFLVEDGIVTGIQIRSWND